MPVHNRRPAHKNLCPDELPLWGGVPGKGAIPKHILPAGKQRKRRARRAVSTDGHPKNTASRPRWVCAEHGPCCMLPPPRGLRFERILQAFVSKHIQLFQNAIKLQCPLGGLHFDIILTTFSHLLSKCCQNAVKMHFDSILTVF